jgi:hypothetical protein
MRFRVKHETKTNVQIVTAISTLGYEAKEKTKQGHVAIVSKTDEYWTNPLP